MPLPDPSITDPQNAANLNYLDRRATEIQAAARKRIAATEDDINALQAQPACRVYRSTNQSIPDITLTTVTFDSERFDDSGMHSTSSNTSRITFATAGVYLVIASGRWAGSAAGLRSAQIRLNGTTDIANVVTGPSGNESAFGLPTLYRFSANDYVELLVFQSTGGALNLLSTGNYTPEFSAVRLCT